MSQLETIFKFASAVAMSGWLILMVLPMWSYGPTVVLYVSFILLAFIYIFLLQMGLRQKPDPGTDKPGFSTFRGVKALLINPTGALTAWVHILAFDLMIGFYIQQQGSALGISHWFLLPCYFFTLMLGPIGLLMFVGLATFMGHSLI